MAATVLLFMFMFVMAATVLLFMFMFVMAAAVLFLRLETFRLTDFFL